MIRSKVKLKFSLLSKKHYKLRYVSSYSKSLINSLIQLGSLHQSLEYDLVFILDQGNKGWILDAICQEIANYFSGKFTFVYGEYFPRGNFETYTPQSIPPLPKAKAYFFAHYTYLATCLKLYPNLWNCRTFVFYTHPKGLMQDEEFAFVMNRSTKVICMCEEFAKRIIACGVNSRKVAYVLGAADPEKFKPHLRSGQAAVGFCTAYYPRKSPDRILEIVKLLPHRKFILLGKHWQRYERFSELSFLPNFSYVEASYEEYPSYYATMDVFVSAARLEGGPIPLIEAMMCNVVPVTSKTGFAPDLIEHGKNGFLFDINDSAESICQLIEQAFNLNTDVRATIEHLSWKNFSLEMQKNFEVI